MFGIDPRALFGGDLKAFTDQIQDAAAGGQFHPLQLFAGTSHLHSVLLVPLSPQVEAARTAFLKDGSGPFAGLPQQIQSQQQLDSASAMQQARLMMQQTQGFCVIVIENDQGLQPMPHMVLGSLPDDFIEALAASLQEAGLAEETRSALLHLRDKAAQDGMPIHDYFISDISDDAAEFWPDTAARLCEGLDEGVLPAAGAPISDLAWCCAQAMRSACAELDGEELLLHARCAALGAELEDGLQSLATVLTEYEIEPDDILPVCEELGRLAQRSGRGLEMERVLQQQEAEFSEELASCYELALLRFRLLASSAVDAEQLIPAAELLQQIDSRACRHDLNKEPVWQVHRTDADDELLDTADAAELLERSLQFVSKRLSNGTLPCLQQDGEWLLPRRALLAWQAVMQRLQLLD